MDTIRTDCLVIGAGLAGCSYAHYASQLGMSVTLVCSNELSKGANSQWAQGGIIFDTSLNAEQLKRDIISASDSTSNPEAVDSLVEHGQEAVQSLLLDELNVPFDREKTGDLKYTREGGHTDRRIIFSKDLTGLAILTNMHEHVVGLKNVSVLTNTVAVDLLTLSHNSLDPLDKYKPITCIGAYVLDTQTGNIRAIIAKKTILATGGMGQIFQKTTPS